MRDRTEYYKKRYLNLTEEQKEIRRQKAKKWAKEKYAKKRAEWYQQNKARILEQQKQLKKQNKMIKYKVMRKIEGTEYELGFELTPASDNNVPMLYGSLWTHMRPQSIRQLVEEGILEEVKYPDEENNEEIV